MQRTRMEGGTGWSLVADATLTYLGTPYTIPGGVAALCDDGGVALDIPAKYYVIYVLVSAPTVLRACRQEQWIPTYTADDVLSIAYLTDAYDIPMPLSGRCVPFVGQPDPFITLFAGTTNTPGNTGDGGPATGATLSNPGALAVDRFGAVYFMDQTRNAVNLGAVRKVAPDGTISTIVTGLSWDFGGAGYDIAIDNFVNFGPRGGLLVVGDTLYVSDPGHHKILSCALDGSGLATAVGTGTSGTTSAPTTALSCNLRGPNGLLLKDAATILFSELGSNLVRQWKLDTGIVSVVVGHSAGNLPAQFNGSLSAPVGVGSGATDAGVYVGSPQDLALGADGTLYISSAGLACITTVSPEGVIGSVFTGGAVHQTTTSGGDVPVPVHFGFGCPLTPSPLSGDDGAKFTMAMDAGGINLLFFMCGTLWRTQPLAGTYTAVAGAATSGANQPGCRLSTFDMQLNPTPTAQPVSAGLYGEDAIGMCTAPDGSIYISTNKHRVLRIACG